MLGNFGFDQNLPPSWSLENDTLPWVHIINGNTNWEGDRYFGRVAYTYGTTLDQPLSIVRIQFGDTLALSGHPWRWWPAFAVIPHWNWRGEADYGTLGGLGANNGGYYTCWPGETNRCIGPLWRPRLFSIAQQRPDTAVFQWYGTLLAGKEDGAGLQYHRNRYVDPATGRFTQEDPIGLAGGLNLYGFASGDPVNFGDPFGLTVCFAGSKKDVQALAFIVKSATNTTFGLDKSNCIVGSSVKSLGNSAFDALRDRFVRFVNSSAKFGVAFSVDAYSAQIAPFRIDIGINVEALGYDTGRAWGKCDGGESAFMYEQVFNHELAHHEPELEGTPMPPRTQAEEDRATIVGDNVFNAAVGRRARCQY